MSAHGKSNVAALVKKYAGENMLVIADGAAFCCEMEKLNQFIEGGANVSLYLPESFEWIILKSGLIEGVEEILARSYDFVESTEFLSWERYFSAIFIEKN